MIIKLNETHKDAVKQLFFSRKDYMGSLIFCKDDDKFQENLYNIFCDSYLSDLKHHHAFGFYNKDTDTVEALMSFYQSVSEPSWFFTVGRSLGNNLLLKDILDVVMDFNEKQGLFKFYTVINSKQARLVRRLGFSKSAIERYDFFDEYVIAPRKKTFYSTHWELLYKRSLVPVETVVRCTFLKQQYRHQLPNAGAI